MRDMLFLPETEFDPFKVEDHSEDPAETLDEWLNDTHLKNLKYSISKHPLKVKAIMILMRSQNANESVNEIYFEIFMCFGKVICDLERDENVYGKYGVYII